MLSNIKKILYPAVLLIFFAFTFQSNPPGWYQQTLPVNDVINDIFFIDSLNGWAVTNGRRSTGDTAYIIKTTNAGNNWFVQLFHIDNIQSIQFLNKDTGYAVGGRGYAEFFKTTNGGVSWDSSKPFGTNVSILNNLSFINTFTGWITGDDALGGGVFKTTNGGNSWVRQTNPDSEPLSIFMLNQDTGWFGGDYNGINSKLFRTTNGGLNWILQFTSFAELTSIFFLNSQKGWIRGGTSSTNGIAYTTNGGINWTDAGGGYSVPLGYDIKFINDSIGYSGATSFKMPKSTDGGKTWGYQIVPQAQALQVAIISNDTTRIWAGSNGLIHTTDGGGAIMDIEYIGTEIPAEYNLSQNYPNPFNPTTKISFGIKRKTGNVKLDVFDASGKFITTLVNQSFNTGTYEVTFNAANLSSGVYFYSLITENFKETKKMLLLK